MLPRATRTGGRARARRPLLPMIALCAFVTGAPVHATADAQGPTPVIVREAGGVYSVAVRFTVVQPASVALAVLTDYEQIPRFMPDVKTSIVRERSAGRVVVEQEAVSRVMLFSKRIHLLLQVCEERAAVRFRDQSGRSFSRYEGAWLVGEQDGQTIISYELSAKPSFAVPEFLLKRLLTSDAHRMIDRLRTEIAARTPAPSDARGAGTAPPAPHRSFSPGERRGSS